MRRFSCGAVQLSNLQTKKIEVTSGTEIRFLDTHLGVSVSQFSFVVIHYLVDDDLVSVSLLRSLRLRCAQLRLQFFNCCDKVISSLLQYIDGRLMPHRACCSLRVSPSGVLPSLNAAGRNRFSIVHTTGGDVRSPFLLASSPTAASRCPPVLSPSCGAESPAECTTRLDWSTSVGGECIKVT